MQIVDLAHWLTGDLQTILDSGGPQIVIEPNVTLDLIRQIEDRPDWFEDQIETFALALDRDFVAEFNCRANTLPADVVVAANWEKDLAGVCD